MNRVFPRSAGYIDTFGLRPKQLINSTRRKKLLWQCARLAVALLLRVSVFGIELSSLLVLTENKVIKQRAARRDASRYRKPGRAGRYHIMIDGELGSRCGLVILDDSDVIPAGDVAKVLRCRRNGCKQHFDKT